jgi:hypothetical protein
MSVHESDLEALVVPLLAVNRFGLEKVYALLPALRNGGLTSPNLVAKKDVGDVMMRLCHAGYDRGMLTEMMAGRLVSLMNAVIEGKLDYLNDFVTNNKRDEALALLCTVNGIGPAVAKDAWVLLRDATKGSN